MSVEVVMKVGLDRRLPYVQWEGWRWRDLDGRGVDLSVYRNSRKVVGGVDTLVIQLRSPTGETVASMSEHTQLLKRAILEKGISPERLVIYVVSDDYWRLVQGSTTHPSGSGDQR